MSQPFPTNLNGVEVTLDALDPNGNFISIGTVTSDASGLFKKMWMPEVPGEYTVIATFGGSESYWSSYAETSVGVSEAPSETSQPAAQADNSMLLYGILVAIVIAIVIGLVAVVLVLRRK